MRSHRAMQKQCVLLLLVPAWHCCWSKRTCHPSRCLCVWRIWHWARLLLFWRSWSPPWESTALPSILLSSSEAWESFGRNPKDFSRLVKKKVKSKAGMVHAALLVQVQFWGTGKKAKIWSYIATWGYFVQEQCVFHFFENMVQSTLFCCQVRGESVCLKSGQSQALGTQGGFICAWTLSFNTTCWKKPLWKAWKIYSLFLFFWQHHVYF